MFTWKPFQFQTAWLGLCGGADIPDCVRRVVNQAFTLDLQRLLNRTGSKGKLSILCFESHIKGNYGVFVCVGSALSRHTVETNWCALYRVRVAHITAEAAACDLLM